MVGTNQGFSGCSNQKSLDKTKQTSKEISKVSCYLDSGLFTYKKEMLLFKYFFFYQRKRLWKIYNQKVTFSGTVPHDLHFWNSLLSSLETNVSNLTSWICYRGIKQNLPFFSPTSLSIFQPLDKKIRRPTQLLFHLIELI